MQVGVRMRRSGFTDSNLLFFREVLMGSITLVELSLQKMILSFSVFQKPFQKKKLNLPLALILHTQPKVFTKFSFQQLQVKLRKTNWVPLCASRRVDRLARDIHRRGTTGREDGHRDGRGSDRIRGRTEPANFFKKVV